MTHRRPSDRRRGGGPQAHRSVLASADEGGGLSLRAPGAGGQVANKTRALELQAGQPQQKGNRRGATYAYNITAIFVGRWKPRRPKDQARGRLNSARQE